MHLSIDDILIKAEYDVDLFEEHDLYDINTIGSLFKAWLRELPDELFPRSTQAMIAEKCEGATGAPQMLKDELSRLPPYNYYLLFAITCHLNLLHSYVEHNKMDYRNLCICFQPCMKIDAFCFQFLVRDWKNCWQGCWTEKEFLKEETELAERSQKEKESSPKQSPKGSPKENHEDEKPNGSGTSSSPQENPIDDNEKAVTSSESETDDEEQSHQPTSTRRKERPPRIDTSHSRVMSQLPELGPLSPIEI